MKLSYRVNKEKEVNGAQEMENTFIDENRVIIHTQEKKNAASRRRSNLLKTLLRLQCTFSPLNFPIFLRKDLTNLS